MIVLLTMMKFNDDDCYVNNDECNDDDDGDDNNDVLCNSCFNLMNYVVLDPLKYIVFCGLRNYDELSSKPVSIHEKLYKCTCAC